MQRRSTPRGAQCGASWRRERLAPMLTMLSSVAQQPPWLALRRHRSNCSYAALASNPLLKHRRKIFYAIGFEQHVVRTGTEEVIDLGSKRAGRECDDRSPTSTPFALNPSDLARCVEAAHARHQVVHEDSIEPLHPEGCNALAPVSCGYDLHSQSCKHALGENQSRDIVIDYENAQAHSAHLSMRRFQTDRD